MATALSASRPGRGQLKGWHALLWFLGFFGFMFIVNGIFLWAAITSFPGEDVKKSYLTGLDYNREIARRALQAEQGWRAEIGLIEGGSGPELHTRLLKADGAALPVFATTATMRHPTDTALDRTLELTAIGGGEYSAPLGDIHPGIWGVAITADVDPEADGHEFHAVREILVP